MPKGQAYAKQEENFLREKDKEYLALFSKQQIVTDNTAEHSSLELSYPTTLTAEELSTLRPNSEVMTDLAIQPKHSFNLKTLSPSKNTFSLLKWFLFLTMIGLTIAKETKEGKGEDFTPAPSNPPPSPAPTDAFVAPDDETPAKGAVPPSEKKTKQPKPSKKAKAEEKKKNYTLEDTTELLQLAEMEGSALYRYYASLSGKQIQAELEQSLQDFVKGTKEKRVQILNNLTYEEGNKDTLFRRLPVLPATSDPSIYAYGQNEEGVFTRVGPFELLITNNAQYMFMIDRHATTEQGITLVSTLIELWNQFTKDYLANIPEDKRYLEVLLYTFAKRVEPFADKAREAIDKTFLHRMENAADSPKEALSQIAKKPLFEHKQRFQEQLLKLRGTEPAEFAAIGPFIVHRNFQIQGNAQYRDSSKFSKYESITEELVEQFQEHWKKMGFGKEAKRYQFDLLETYAAPLTDAILKQGDAPYIEQKRAEYAKEANNGEKAAAPKARNVQFTQAEKLQQQMGRQRLEIL